MTKRIYCMSDIHGDLNAFVQSLGYIEKDLLDMDTKLILLGDYVHGPDSYGVLKKIQSLQKELGDRCQVLRGNHEEMCLDGRWPFTENRDGSVNEIVEDEEEILAWMKTLPLFYVEEGCHYIFCHAGIEEGEDEESASYWQWSTDDYTFLEKYPAQTGTFFGNMTIVAGHIGTYQISGDKDYHDIFWDGQSHIYCDGTTEVSGKVPVLMIDVEKGKFFQVDSDGKHMIRPKGEY